MSLTRQEAIDDMLGRVKAAWDTTGFGSRVAYDAVGTTSAPPSGQEPWIRPMVRHSGGEQATLQGETGNRRFRRFGTLTVQVFHPVGVGLVGGATDYADVIRDAFEGVGSNEGMIYRDVSVNEIGVDGDFFQSNVQIDFEYDELK